MAQRHEDQDPRKQDEDREQGSDQRSPRGSRSNVSDEPPLKPGEPQRKPGDRGGSRHSLHDTDPPDVRFDRDVGDADESEGNLSDFTDETSGGHHAGYGDYGQQDYGPHGEGRKETKPGSATPSGGSVSQPRPSRQPKPARERESKPAEKKTQGDIGRSTPKTG